MTTSTGLEIVVDCGRAGAGPATWGQQAIWDVVSALDPADAPRYNIVTDSPLEPALPVPLVLESLRRLLELHDGLRTRLRPDGAGGLEQVVDRGGRLPVAVRRCGDDAAEVAQAGLLLREELGGRPFDSAEEWPIRPGIVEVGGLVRHFVLVLAHTAVDGFGMRRLVMNLTALVQGATAAELARRQPCFQPLEEAAFQCSERGRRRDARARQHWRRKLKLAPVRQLPAPAADSPQRLFPNAVLGSPALARAVPRLAAELRISPPSVLLGAAAVMTARLAGSEEAAFQVVVNNRFLPGLANAVSVVAGDGLFHLTGTGDDFADVLRRSHATSLAAYSHAYFNKRLLTADLAELTGAGPVADRSCVVNDTLDLVPGPPAEEPGERPEQVSLRELRTRTTLDWPVEFEPRPGLSFALDAARTPTSLDLAMTADGTVLPRADIERFLCGMEELIVDRALALGVE